MHWSVGPWDHGRGPAGQGQRRARRGVVWPVRPSPGCGLARALATGLPPRSSDPGPDPAGSGPAEPEEKGDAPRQEHSGNGWTPKSHVHLDKATGLSGCWGSPNRPHKGLYASVGMLFKGTPTASPTPGSRTRLNLTPCSNVIIYKQPHTSCRLPRATTASNHFKGNQRLSSSAAIQA